MNRNRHFPEVYSAAIEKAKLEANAKGYSVTEAGLVDGSIRLTVNVGGES